MGDHRTFLDGMAGAIHYWKVVTPGFASVASDRAEATHAIIKVGGSEIKIMRSGVPTGELDGWYELDNMTRILNRVFQAGREDKLKELRKFLGIKE